MEKLDILYQIFGLNTTLYQAVDYVRQNINTDEDLKMILQDIDAAVQTISGKTPLVLDQARTEEIRKITDVLRNSCRELMHSRKAARDFFARCQEWHAVCTQHLCLEAVNTANACGGDDEERAIALLEIVLSYDPSRQIKALADFTLSRKLNKRQPRRAYDLGMEAFALHDSLYANITPVDSPIHKYVFTKVKDVYFDTCPICHEGEGTPYFCAMPMLTSNYTPLFNPVKLWMRCDSCGQLYAYNFPRKFAEPQPESEELGDEIYMRSTPRYLPIFGDLMKRILAHANGKRLLEVGAGTGELIAVALEYGCEVEAVEISLRQSQRLQKLLGVDVHCMDFLDYDTSRHFDIVTMGDVIEHVTDPTAAIEKAHDLLADEGVLWISTPNFESGFSRIMKYDDPMWNEPWHVTYFSRDGLEDILRQNGFIVLEYTVSRRFNGSMEIIAKKA